MSVVVHNIPAYPPRSVLSISRGYIVIGAACRWPLPGDRLWSTERNVTQLTCADKPVPARLENDGLIRTLSTVERCRFGMPHCANGVGCKHANVSAWLVDFILRLKH